MVDFGGVTTGIQFREMYAAARSAFGIAKMWDKRKE